MVGVVVSTCSASRRDRSGRGSSVRRLTQNKRKQSEEPALYSPGAGTGGGGWRPTRHNNVWRMSKLQQANWLLWKTLQLIQVAGDFSLPRNWRGAGDQEEPLLG